MGRDDRFERICPWLFSTEHVLPPRDCRDPDAGRRPSGPFSVAQQIFDDFVIQAEFSHFLDAALEVDKSCIVLRPAPRRVVILFQGRQQIASFRAAAGPSGFEVATGLRFVRMDQTSARGHVVEITRRRRRRAGAVVLCIPLHDT